MIHVTIVEGRIQPDLNQNYIAFGAYMMVHTGTENNNKSGDIHYIALKLLNEKGGYIFTSLLSRRTARGID